MKKLLIILIATLLVACTSNKTMELVDVSGKEFELMELSNQGSDVFVYEYEFPKNVKKLRLILEVYEHGELIDSTFLDATLSEETRKGMLSIGFDDYLHFSNQAYSMKVPIETFNEMYESEVGYNQILDYVEKGEDNLVLRSFVFGDDLSKDQVDISNFKDPDYVKELEKCALLKLEMGSFLMPGFAVEFALDDLVEARTKEYDDTLDMMAYDLYKDTDELTKLSSFISFMNAEDEAMCSWNLYTNTDVEEIINNRLEAVDRSYKIKLDRRVFSTSREMTLLELDKENEKLLFKHQKDFLTEYLVLSFDDLIDHVNGLQVEELLVGKDYLVRTPMRNTEQIVGVVIVPIIK